MAGRLSRMSACLFDLAEVDDELFFVRCGWFAPGLPFVFSAGVIEESFVAIGAHEQDLIP